MPILGVQKTIAAFGGNPAKATIFGERYFSSFRLCPFSNLH
jgi:hypothetical protein